MSGIVEIVQSINVNIVTCASRILSELTCNNLRNKVVVCQLVGIEALIDNITAAGDWRGHRIIYLCFKVKSSTLYQPLPQTQSVFQYEIMASYLFPWQKISSQKTPYFCRMSKKRPTLKFQGLKLNICGDIWMSRLKLHFHTVFHITFGIKAANCDS